MSFDRRQRAVSLAVALVAGGTVAGVLVTRGGSPLVTCGGVAAPLSAAGAGQLHSYAGWIQLKVQRSGGAVVSRSWENSATGATHDISYEPPGSQTEVTQAGDKRRFTYVLRGRFWVSDSEQVGSSSVETPDVVSENYRTQIEHGLVKVDGTGLIDGRAALHLLRIDPSTPGAIRIDAWVDPTTYLPIRLSSRLQTQTTVTDVTWLPPTNANLAKTRLVIPPGTHEQKQNGATMTSIDFASAQHNGCSSAQ